MSENNNKLSAQEFVIECDPILMREEDNCVDTNLNNNQWIQLETLLIENERLRSGLDLNELKFDNNLKIDTEEEVTRNEIWKIQRMDTHLQLIDKDCDQLLSFSPINQLQFKELERKIDQTIHMIRHIQQFQVNNHSNVDHILSQSYHQLKVNISKEEEFRRLKEEMAQMEKELALLDVFIVENGSLQECKTVEAKLEAEVKQLKKENIQLERDLMALKVTQITFMAGLDSDQ